MTPRHSRAACALGALTALAGVALLASSGAPVLIAGWLVLCGLVLAGLGIDAGRRERRTAVAVAALDRAESARRAADARSRELADHSGDVLATLSPDGVIREISGGCFDLLELTADELAASRAADLVHPGDSTTLVSALQRLSLHDERFAITVRLRRADGSWRWADAQLLAVRDNGVLAEIHATIRDVHARAEAERAKADAEARFRTAFEEAPIGMAIASIDGRFLQVNHALCAITGREQEELEGTPLVRLLHPEDREDEAEALARLARGTGTAARGERRWLHAAGKIVWASLNATLVRDAAGVPQHILLQVQDVTERRRYESELRYLADHDPLTGLLNRRAFAHELEEHIEHVRRYGPTGAAMVLDLDHFKNINDTLGHGTGDELIVALASALRHQLGPRVAIARLGGDELALLIPDGDVREIADEILEIVRGQRVASPSGRLRSVSASIGVAGFDEAGLNAEDVLANADLAMYEAKEAGRDRAVAYRPAADASSRDGRVSWPDIIRDGLDEDRFVLQAQPIMNLATGDTGQFELLLRLRDPFGELISPAAFLPAAERYDLIGAIDRWVVSRSIAMLAEENRRGRRLTFEINISGRSAGDPDLLALIEGELRTHEVDPAQVIFEITETTAVANIPRAQEFANRLAALGCRFALDDFGAAFASFYYLKHLPFDYLKIDGEFVRGCVADRTDQLVIQAVVDIARGLGKRTVAEMVGDEETMTLVRNLGVDYVQGFHIGRPAPLARWLVDSKPADKRRHPLIVPAR
ncbi:MAG TPA: EAL domain-containing protein [Solirubrobacteraceae bacterium]|nr:EAL domain-containing protein [Solirubrobacteraceae bacterium]